jgi:hypothetical protein
MTLAVAIRKLHRGIQSSGIELTVVIGCRIAFSARDHFRDFAEPCQGKNDEIFAIHKVVFMLTVIPTFVNHLPVDAWQVVMGNASLLERGCDGRH